MPTGTNVDGDALCFMVMGPPLLQRLAVGGWWLVVVGSSWRLAVGGSWRLAVGGCNRPTSLACTEQLGIPNSCSVVLGPSMGLPKAPLLRLCAALPAQNSRHCDHAVSGAFMLRAQAPMSHRCGR